MNIIKDVLFIIGSAIICTTILVPIMHYMTPKKGFTFVEDRIVKIVKCNQCGLEQVERWNCRQCGNFTKEKK